MTTRRDFIKTSVLIAGSGGFATAALGAEPSRHPIHRAVFDTRFAESREFGWAVAAQGHRAVGVNGDVTRLWTQDLSPLWRRSPAAIAGMTAPDVLFCLERLAYDHGMGIALRVTHSFDGQGNWSHVAEGDGRFDPSAFGMERFAAGAALAIDSCGRAGQTLGQTCIAPEATAGIPLVTWVIAARNKSEVRV